MKTQALFSLKDKSKKLKFRLLHFLFGALRVNFTLLPFLSEVGKVVLKFLHKLDLLYIMCT